jgi:hypothetical protein
MSQLSKRTAREGAIIEVRRALRTMLKEWEGQPLSRDERAAVLDHLMRTWVLPSPALREPEQ